MAKSSTSFTKETAKAAQLRGAKKKREMREAGREIIARFVNREMVDLLFDTPKEEALDRLANPKTVAEAIVAQRAADPAKAFEMLQDFMDRVLGRPKQQVDANVDAQMTINLDTTGLYGEPKK